MIRLTAKQIAKSEVFWLAVLFSTCLAVSAEANEQDLNTIRSAWKTRIGQIRTLSLSWEGAQFWGAAFPPMHTRKHESATFPYKTSIYVEPQVRVRLDYKGQEWSDDNGAFVSKHMLSVFEGAQLTRYFLKNNVQFPNAHVKKATFSDVAADVQLLAVRVFAMPCDPSCGVISESSLSLTTRIAVQDGETCKIIRCKEGEVWIGGSPHYLPVRLVQIDDGHVFSVTKVSYSSDNGVPRPAEWTIVQHARDGNVDQSWSAKVVDCVINGPAPSLELAFDPGTWVENYATKESYILRPDGTRRDIRPGEFNGRNYYELAYGTRYRWVPPLVLLVVLVSIAALFCVIYIRRRTLSVRCNK